MRRLRYAAGFTYLTILFVVAIMGLGLALAGEVWHTAAVREREAMLLDVGEQYRKAIERYYLAGPRQYPRALEQLLRDPRKPGIERYLRRLYPDPVTNSDDWGIVKAPDGGIMGVYSRAEDAPRKEAQFRPAQAAFEGAKKYSDWKFVFVPQAAAQPTGSKSAARINQ
jgi:type II secretory pathway pseudopilin PulG